ncbi:histidine kinase [Streptomyces sp. NPDC093085]|uniref:sensor histidine kinase n=1 Tax=Streptomyces sp. NPDC093085 TaxID=3155068 RepID=UPI00341C4F25
MRHPRVPDWWRRLDVTVRDLPLGLLLLVGSLIPAFQSHGTQVGGLPARPYDALAVVALALECFPLAVRRRMPALCLALTSVGFAVDQLRGYHSLAGTGFSIAVLSTGAHLERRRWLTAALFSVAYAALAVALYRLGTTTPGATGETPDELATFFLALALVWGAGAWLRSIRFAEAERRRRIAEDSRAAERTLIARELHDVVTHHVTAMVVQAEAARYLTAAPERLGQSLGAITDTGRRAITDLRHLLDVLNPDHGVDGGVPSVDRILALVEDVRRAGQPVEFREEGARAGGGGGGRAGFVAYRVVQEALTNALKYAHGHRTSVLVRHGEREISVEVSTNAPGAGGSSGAGPGGGVGGSGRGLAGLRERVDGLGGEFSAGPVAGGGFVVRARIPAESTL